MRSSVPVLLPWLLALPLSHGGELPRNLVPNAGFDDPARSGWSSRGRPISLDRDGAYGTPCLRVE